MHIYIIFFVAVIYLSLLFFIARYATKKPKGIFSSGIFYAMSLGVFCTGWTFFGSIGNASKTGYEFLPVYLGPTIFMPIICIVLLKIIRICKMQRITSIADFISSRYGKNVWLGYIVTFCCILGVLPYIALQLKAIGNSVALLTNQANTHTYNNIAIIIPILLAFFIIIYGVRNIDTTERRQGMVAAITFESIIKLLAFLIAGIYICYYLYHGVGDIFQQALVHSEVKKLLTFKEKFSPFSWLIIALVSSFAIVLLPRQFHVAVVENTNEKHLKKALWIFPLYLLLINIFVLPIAVAGQMSFGNQIHSDSFMLYFPIFNHNAIISIIIFLGGLSAATGMIIVETIALTIMISNNITLPFIIKQNFVEQQSQYLLTKGILNSRRVGVAVLLLLAYLFEKNIATKISLVGIGLISFAAVAQLAPAVFIGIYWKKANTKAAISSIIIGFGCWFYLLVLPSLKDNFIWVQNLIEQGPFGISLLKPTQLLGLTSLDEIANGMFWSLLINIMVFILVSLYTTNSHQEQFQAEIFVNIKNYYTQEIATNPWKGVTLMKDIKNLLAKFIGLNRATSIIEGYAIRNTLSTQGHTTADQKMVAFVEKILGGVIGSASSRLMISSVTKDEKITIDEVLSIVKESQQILELNKELRKKTLELGKATQQITQTNQQLKTMDELKDEFLYTVTHELRTPLTSIRALSEILQDNPDLEPDLQAKYLEGIITETQRLSHLITEVLNLEKYESGRQIIYPTSFDVKEMVQKYINAIEPLTLENKLEIKLIVENSNILLHADKDLIGQVIYNLLSNATKYARKKIEVFIIPTLDEVIIKVKDDGTGIAPDKLEMIFDKFYQVKQKELQKPIGSGLGLAICKKIVELHHGQIFVTSKQNMHTTFTLHLPLVF